MKDRSRCVTHRIRHCRWSSWLTPRSRAPGNEKVRYLLWFVLRRSWWRERNSRDSKVMRPDGVPQLKAKKLLSMRDKNVYWPESLTFSFWIIHSEISLPVKALGTVVRKSFWLRTGTPDVGCCIALTIRSMRWNCSVRGRPLCSVCPVVSMIRSSDLQSKKKNEKEESKTANVTRSSDGGKSRRLLCKLDRFSFFSQRTSDTHTDTTCKRYRNRIPGRREEEHEESNAWDSRRGDERFVLGEENK